MRESEFGHHEDGLPGGEHEEEVARVSPRRRDKVSSKKFIPIEQVPGSEPDPLERLVAKEEAMGDRVHNTDLLEDDAEEFATFEGVVEPAPLDERAIKKVDERTIVHGARGHEPLGSSVELKNNRRDPIHDRGQQPLRKNIDRTSIRPKRPQF